MMMMPGENVSAVMPPQQIPTGIIRIILTSSPRYAFLFKLNPEDYESWAYGLKKAGYATNIKYPQILIKLIQDYDLEKYSLIAMGKLPPEEPIASKSGSRREPTGIRCEGFTDSANANRRCNNHRLS